MPGSWLRRFSTCSGSTTCVRAALLRGWLRATPDGQVAGSRDLVTDLVIYLVPVYGIAARSATMGDTFLDLPVKAVGLPQEVITALGFAAAVAGLVWLVRSSISFVRGTLDTLYAGFVLSHVAIFLVAYIGIEDAGTGWLAIDVWHNLPARAGRLDDESEESTRAASIRLRSSYRESASRAAWRSTSRVASRDFHPGLRRARQFRRYAGGGLAITVGIYMGINFHHYVIDALISKRRPVITQSI